MEENHKIIIGLGNPGKKYKYTRHNVGFIVLDYILSKYSYTQKIFNYSISYNLKKHNITLVKPITYMNNSGKAIRELIEKGILDSKKMLIIYDDFHIPFGKIRFRRKGTAGGHNGIKSIITTLHTEEFDRLKIGIGINGKIIEPINFVLGEFSKEEKSLLDELLPIIEEGIFVWIYEGVEKAMNMYNGLDLLSSFSDKKK